MDNIETLYAWSICDRILTERRDLPASYFAAQTIRQKLVHSMKELPASTHIALRDSLINHLRLDFFIFTLIPPKTVVVIVVIVIFLCKSLSGNYIFFVLFNSNNCQNKQALLIGTLTVLPLFKRQPLFLSD
ncbi:unnamed protein product [Gongylonema pulchrum]|uniref:Importin N-terminal domain-containing protein n=1 Tax=Gongylonema pulchrum TaxID=637853 RepID=A0A183DBS4_9BILA|nr:unnamed protein product [Gongylonema pulchrum]